jgi:RNA polymerase sigma-70 factor (ECF subfamily)
MNALSILFGQIVSPLAQTPDEQGTETRQERLSARQTMHRDAVQQMIEQHSRLVYRAAFAVVRNAADAEDVVQETFLQLLRTSPDMILNGAIEDERSYLARVAWRLSVRRCTRPAAEPRSGEILLQQSSPAKTPEQSALENDLEAWLHLQIDELPEKLRQPLALAALGELTSPQIAAILGIPEGSVRRRIHAARQILRHQMEKQKGGSK